MAKSHKLIAQAIQKAAQSVLTQTLSSTLAKQLSKEIALAAQDDVVLAIARSLELRRPKKPTPGPSTVRLSEPRQPDELTGI